MPVHYEFDTTHRILCTAFAGKFRTDEPLQVLSEFAEKYAGLGGISVLSVFFRDSDLSDVTPDQLYELRDALSDGLTEHGIIRERSAFLINGSIDLIMLGPLWQGINAADQKAQFPMRFFNSIEEAAEFLGKDVGAVRTLVGRVEAGIKPDNEQAG